MKTKKRVSPFTLLELLIVVAIIGILLTLLLPSLTRAREKAIRAVCLSNQQQVYRGFVRYIKDNNGKLPPGANAYQVKYKHIDQMGLYEAPEIWRCPNWKKDVQDGFYDLTDEQRQNRIAKDTFVMTGFHLLTGGQSYNQGLGGRAWRGWRTIYENKPIPLITDRNRSSNDTTFRSKILHTKNGGVLLEVNSLTELESWGCEGSNETSVQGSGKWVGVSKLEAHRYNAGVGFWSRQYKE